MPGRVNTTQRAGRSEWSAPSVAGLDCHFDESYTKSGWGYRAQRSGSGAPDERGAHL